MIEIRGLTVEFGGVRGLNELSADIGAKITGLVGPNGAGKTTLLNVMSGFVRRSAGTVTIDGEDLLVKHCYVERRLRPLNLYARENPFETARAAVLDYGQAIKELAQSNIFPGDLLLKNFGVSNRGRAIFYDYDELCLLGQCRFRRLPEAREEDETRRLS